MNNKAFAVVPVLAAVLAGALSAHAGSSCSATIKAVETAKDQASVAKILEADLGLPHEEALKLAGDKKKLVDEMKADCK
jgi:hypothetical protein